MIQFIKNFLNWERAAYSAFYLVVGWIANGLLGMSYTSIIFVYVCIVLGDHVYRTERQFRYLKEEFVPMAKKE